MTRPTRCPVLVERDEELRAPVHADGGEPAAARTRPAARARARRRALPRPSAIGELGRRLDEPGSDAILVLITFRLGFHRAGSAEMRALARLVRDPRALELRVMPLSAEGVAQMAAAMGRYAGEELFRRTGGNAFWAEELLREDERIPWTVVESIAAQLDVLPGEARELACALAVAEEPLSARAADELVGDVDAAWTALIEAGLAETDGAGVWLRHALVGEAISSRLGPMESERWHGLLAAALEAEGADPDRVARHWAAAGDSMVERELMAHPAVIDAAVVGRPHPELGEVPVAYVSLREDEAAGELLRGFFDSRLAPWKHPRDVIVVDNVPRSANGKLMRRELIAREREAHGLTISGSARS